MADQLANGGSGIALSGREVEYATELWLSDPSAFWLHPEGPLSDKTPEQWRAEQEEKEAARTEHSRHLAQLQQSMQLDAIAQMQMIANPYAAGMLQNRSQSMLGLGLQNAFRLW